MITISLCMIVKNEEQVLARCLDSVAELVDEIVIVDTGSTDQTKEIAAKYTSKVLDFKWIDDFAAARNYSFSEATMEYIMWLDADDVLLEKDQQKLRELKETFDSRYDAASFVYHYYLDADGNPLLYFQRERLVKRNKHFQWVGFIHEYIAICGEIFSSDIVVTHSRVHHFNDRNLNIYRKKIEEGVEFSTRDHYYYSNELYYHMLWEEATAGYEAFLMENAWVEDKIDAACKLSECYFHLNQYEKERKVLLQSLEYAVPRAEVLFRLANSYEREKRYLEAIYWYETILDHPQVPKNAGFISPEYWTWRPHLQLSVCYYTIGEKKKSYEHHKIAYQMYPDEPMIKLNQEFFLKELEKEET